MLNFCANNYLGLANHPDADRGGPGGARPLRLRHGLGALHLRHPGPSTRSSRARIARFLGTDDAILYSSCFDANGGLFETLLGEEDAVISDALNHASIIDGVRLCKAKRFRYANNDMADLERCLKEAARRRALRADRDRRRVLDGRGRSPICRRSATWPSATTRWSWWTTATPSASSARAAAARPSSAASRTASTSSPAPSARRSAAPRAASPAGGARSSRCCASARGPISSPTRSRRSSRRRR